MFDETRICPYPGLRSFNEDESIYFKGRDAQVDDVVELLQANKFLMVTGASGDGKSSMIFAGLVPNARAGFFKSKYNNWTVSHFRPERNPVKNFAHSLSEIFTDLGLPTIETELNRGFSSLVDLYKNSPLSFDENSNEYLSASDDEKDAIKRKCSNLLIVVDQFEEFYTNTENFLHGAPSQESQTLVNVLLETARISLAENLSIYVVFTMRSDYIGQCAAFRGLPEFIGFSQFFVPRLKRNDLQQVIEEPAELNGDQISRRLVERLLFDMTDGVDQLPILQHALSQIWHMADSDKTMDLIHYAKVGGMPQEDLPADDVEKFGNWFTTLPEWKREHFKEPGLKLILDIHANNLYQTAWDVYTSTYPNTPVSIRDVKRIIALTFACLTKIDDSRAVRNLMTLDEITQIINRRHLTVDIVGKVLNIFRAQGNTLIRPFIEESEPDSQNLHADTVLDITHESLIRNWERLKIWADKEFEYFETFLDFRKQLNKWIESGKSSGYLLAIGPLTYFENWYDECQPNTYWINRYLQVDKGETTESTKILSDTREFLKRSQNKVAISRAFIKYGTARLTAFLAIIFVIGLSSFYYFDSEKKQNASVLRTIQDEATDLLNASEANPFVNGYYLSTMERTFPGSLLTQLNKIDSWETRLESANMAYMQLFSLDNKFRAPVKDDLVQYISNQLNGNEISEESQLRQLDLFLLNLVNDEYNNPGNTGDFIEINRGRIFGLLKVLTTKEVSNKMAFSHGFNHMVNLSQDHTQDVSELLQMITPFESESKMVFDKHFPASGQIENGYRGGVSHNAGYQLVGFMYASLGDVGNAKQCFDSLMKYNPSYMEETNYNNGYNFISYFLQYGHYENLPDLIQYVAKKSEIPIIELLKGLLDRSGFMKTAYSYYWYEVPAYNYGISMISQENMDWIFNYFEKELQKELNGDELHYELALLYKQRGIYIHRRSVDNEKEIGIQAIFGWFNKALDEYKKVGSAYLKIDRQVRYRYYSDGLRDMTKPNWYYFLYPDHIESGWYNSKFISPVFAQYLLSEGVVGEFYEDGEHLETFNDWIANYYEVFNTTSSPNVRRNLPLLPDQFLIDLNEFVMANEQYSSFDQTFLKLLLTNIYFEKGESRKALEVKDQLSTSNLQLLAARWEYLNYTYIQNQILSLAKFLAISDQHESAKTFIETMVTNNERSICYAELAKKIFRNGDMQAGFTYLDSAFSKSEKTDLTIIPFQLDHRYYLMNALSGIGGREMNEMAYDISNKIRIATRDFAITYYISGIAYEGNYYRALQAIPSEGPLNRRLFLYSAIYGEEAARQGPLAGWERFDKEWNRLTKDYVIFNDNF